MPAGSGPDSALTQILKTRLLRSEGAENMHCFTRDPSAAATSTDASAQDMLPSTPGKLFSMSADDTPPASRSPSPSPEKQTRKLSGSFNRAADPQKAESLKGGAEDEAESTDGLPDENEGDEGDLQGDLHYDWQFDLLNSMPREKALELARVLKKSEQEKARESAKLRQEVNGLKKQMTRTSACCKPCCVLGVFSIFVLLLAVAVGFAQSHPDVLQAAFQRLGVTSLERFQGAERQAPKPAEAPPPVTPPVPPATATERTSAPPVTAAATPPPEAAAAAPVKTAAPHLATAAPPVTTAAPPVTTAAAPVTAAAPPVTTAAAPVTAAAAPKVPLWSANIVPGTNKVDLMHAALSQDLSGLGPVKADLGPATAYFPKVSKGWRFANIWVTRSQMDGRQVAVAAHLFLQNAGSATWPAGTALKLILGPSMGLPSLPIGQAVTPGAHIELTMMLEIPVKKNFVRSVWVLEANGEPFGPLLVAEVSMV